MTILPDGAITAADVFREVTATRSEVADMRSTVAVIDERTASARDIDRDHEGRIRRLEDFRSRLFGAAITAGTVSGIISGYIGYLIGHVH